MMSQQGENKEQQNKHFPLKLLKWARTIVFFPYNFENLLAKPKSHDYPWRKIFHKKQTNEYFQQLAYLDN